MSHFTNMKTRFQNLAYLEKALNRLDILHNRKKEINSKDSYNVDLVISQSNGYDIEFCWNGEEYDLVSGCYESMGLPEMVIGMLGGT